MPKIPTFEPRQRITAQAPGVRTGLQVSPTATPAAALVRPTAQLAEYYERERMIAEKAEADKKYLEVSTDLDEIQTNAAKQFNPLEAQSTFERQSRFLINEKINQTQNKRIKNMLSDRFENDLIIRKNNVKKLSRQQLDKQEEYNYNTQYEITLSKYKLSQTKEEKDFYQNQIFSNQESRSLYFNDSDLTKKQSMDNIKKDLLVSDVEQLIENKQYQTAKNILENVDETYYLSADKRETLLSKINDEYQKVLGNDQIDNIVLNKVGVYAVGGQLKKLDGTVIKTKDIEDSLNRAASAKDASGNNKFSTSNVVELSIGNNASVPFYKTVMVSGSANISDTGDANLTQQGLELYRLFKNQNGLSTLRSTYKLDKQTLETYARLDFATNVLKETFDSAYKRELNIKNKPQDFVLRSVQDKKVDSEFKEIDMPGLFDPTIENVQTVKYLLKNISNIYFKAGGTEEDALSGARDYIEKNYKFDLFNQLVPRDNSVHELHDAAIKTYIKKIYDEGLINKEKHEIDDIYPSYFSYGDFSNLQGFVLKNKKTGESLTIDATPPSGDFDDRIYNSARLTQEDVANKIYPLIDDERFKNYVLKSNSLQQKRKTLSDLKKPVVKSGFGDPIE
jgi:hypothetical protein